MNPTARSPDTQAFAVLRRFARSREPVERCELCGVGLAPEHRHLLHMEDCKTREGVEKMAAALLGDPAPHLEPLPLIDEDDTGKVAVRSGSAAPIPEPAFA